MKNKIQILKAEKMGFCFGVKEAIESCEKYITNIENKEKVYILGMLVHNEYVVKEMEKKGFVTLSEEDILEEKVMLDEKSIVIIRAHGTIKKIYEKLFEKNVIIEDGTCIFVKNIREKLVEEEKNKKKIIFLGDKNHPEVRGIVSFGSQVTIVKDLEEVRNLKIDWKEEYSLLCQTTLSKKNIKEIKTFLEKKDFNVIIYDRICGATSERQDAIEIIAGKVDLVLIVGGKNSSNTQKLYEVSVKINSNTKFISDETELKKEWFENVKILGITAGASTPDVIIKKIENRIEEEF